MTDREAKFLEWLRDDDLPEEYLGWVDVFRDSPGTRERLQRAYGIVAKIIERKFLEIVEEK